MVKKIQNNNMDEALQAKAAVVDFSAVWCGPCQMLAPVLEELSGDLDGKVAFYNADTDENTQLAIANGITNIPALLFLKDGKVVGKNVGFMPKPELEAAQQLADRLGIHLRIRQFDDAATRRNG